MPTPAPLPPPRGEWEPGLLELPSELRSDKLNCRASWEHIATKLGEVDSVAAGIHAAIESIEGMRDDVLAGMAMRHVSPPKCHALDRSSTREASPRADQSVQARQRPEDCGACSPAWHTCWRGTSDIARQVYSRGPRRGTAGVMVRKEATRQVRRLGTHHPRYSISHVICFSLLQRTLVLASGCESLRDSPHAAID